jgi:hypothetical protein
MDLFETKQIAFMAKRRFPTLRSKECCAVSRHLSIVRGLLTD